MTRRATKKMLRRAENALIQGRFSEAENIYVQMLTAFEQEAPSLLDHAGCIFGLVRTLYAADRDAEALAVAESANKLLSRSDLMLVAA